MQITFNPMDEAEAAFVLRMFDRIAENAAAAAIVAPTAPAAFPPPPPALPPEAVLPPPQAQADIPTSGVLDARGLPWDSRIHSGNRAFVADGTWRKRRGVEDSVVEAVEAELRAVMAVPADPAAAVFKPDAAVPPPPPPPPAGAAPASAPASVTPPAAPAAATAPPSDFASFMVAVLPRITAGTLTHEQVREAVKAVGLASVENLLARPDLVPDVYARLPQ